MKKDLERIENKLDKLADSQLELYREQMETNADLKVYNSHLEEHMRRTVALEKRVGLPYLLKIGGIVGTIGGLVIKAISLVLLK